MWETNITFSVVSRVVQFLLIFMCKRTYHYPHTITFYTRQTLCLVPEPNGCPLKPPCAYAAEARLESRSEVGLLRCCEESECKFCGELNKDKGW